MDFVRSALAAVRILLLAATLSAMAPTGAGAATGMTSIFQDDPHLIADPQGVLAQLRVLGATTIKVGVRRSTIAPSPNSRTRPRGFHAGDPGARGYNWRIIDPIVRDAAADGIQVNFNLGNAAPLWATGPGAPRDGQRHYNWEPSAGEFGQFVAAVGKRYSGSYRPAGASTPLPRISSWSIWSEPNLGYSIAPQGVPGDLTIENSGRLYRNLLAAAWASLGATHHGPSTDTIMIDELAPRGNDYFGVFAPMKPLQFLRALYCVDSRYRPLRGSAAAIRGCPTTAAGSRRFRAQNPALFNANGVSDHLWARWYPPNEDPQHDPDYAGLPDLGQFERALDRLQRVYGSGRKLPIYNTEFGYITNPPNHSDPFVSPTTASYYLNWAEYLSWRSSRVRSFSQYLLEDPPPNPGLYTGWSSGLLTYQGKPKATYDAWRLPLYLPATASRRGRSLEVWGCARPSRYAMLDGGGPQTVAIQFATGSRSTFTTVRTVTLTTPTSCYFDTRVTFPASGTVRLEWQYPANDPRLGNFGPSQGTVYSRTVQITLR